MGYPIRRANKARVKRQLCLPHGPPVEDGVEQVQRHQAEVLDRIVQTIYHVTETVMWGLHECAKHAKLREWTRKEGDRRQGQLRER